MQRKKTISKLTQNFKSKNQKRDFLNQYCDLKTDAAFSTKIWIRDLNTAHYDVPV
jgi:hypothetical protein